MEQLRAKKGFICDMDGVIYHGNNLIPGVKEFVQWLQSENKSFLFLTKIQTIAVASVNTSPKKNAVHTPFAPNGRIKTKANTTVYTKDCNKQISVAIPVLLVH